VSAAHQRRWGWHALGSEQAALIVADAQLQPGELVLDIGAGHGALTAHLVEAGATVIAVELHPGRANYLRHRFADAPVTVVQCDAGRLRLPRRQFRVVASPPYAVTSPLLRGLLGPHSRMVAANLVLQRAVVRRYVEGGAPGEDRWRRTWTLTRGRLLPRSAFQPPPRVDSAVLVARRR
jgi:23S rRNA (adenine-N6)-dimethyltransferase